MDLKKAFHIECPGILGSDCIHRGFTNITVSNWKNDKEFEARELERQKSRYVKLVVRLVKLVVRLSNSIYPICVK
jgi:hypothetical protein